MSRKKKLITKRLMAVPDTRICYQARIRRRRQNRLSATRDMLKPSASRPPSKKDNSPRQRVPIFSEKRQEPVGDAGQAIWGKKERRKVGKRGKTSPRGFGSGFAPHGSRGDGGQNVFPQITTKPGRLL